MKKIIKTILFTATLLSLGLALAQQAQPLPRHPGDVIKYNVRFDGPNADKITRLNSWVSLKGNVPKDQAGFASSIAKPNVQPSSPKTFELSFTVPQDIADGDYDLSFTAFAAEGYGNYANGDEFKIPLIRIENPKKFVPPAVDVKPIP